MCLLIGVRTLHDKVNTKLQTRAPHLLQLIYFLDGLPLPEAKAKLQNETSYVRTAPVETMTLHAPNKSKIH